MPETQPTSQPPTGLSARFAEEFRRHLRANVRTLVIAVPLTLLLFPAYRVVKAMSGGDSWASEASFEQGKLPTCDAAVVTNLLKQAVEANTSPILGTIKVHKVSGIADYMELTAAINAASNSEPVKQATPPDENMLRVRAALENKRMCGAQLFTSRGQHLWNYNVVWTSPAEDEIYVQAEFGE